MKELNLLVIFFWFAIGGVCAYYARERGRNPFAWFAIGLIFGIIGLVSLFLLPNRKKELLLNNTAQNSYTPPEPAIETIEPEEAPPPPKSNKFWYYLDQVNQQFGPMSYDALQEAWKEGKISLNTYVWNEDLENWTRFEEIETS